MSETSPLTLAELIRRNPMPALRKLEVDEHEETVTLTGTVPSFYLKQLAQEALLPHLAGRRLDNRVTVRRN